MPWKMKLAMGTLVVLIVAGYVTNMAFVLVNASSDASVVLGLVLLFATVIGTWTGVHAVVSHFLPKNQHKDEEKSGMKNRYHVVIAAVTLSLLSSACTRISPGHVGIVVNQWGSEKGVADYAPKTGSFTYNPLTTSVYSYPTYMQNVVWTQSPHEGQPVDESITFTIKGNMAINVDVSAAFDLTAEKVPQFYVQFRNDDIRAFTDGFMRNVARDCFNELGGGFDLDQVMGDNANFVQSVRAELQKRVVEYGVNIKQFGIIGAPRPPEAVRKAIEAKIGATQLAIQKQNELVQATADAAKVVAKAEGDAKATLIMAETQAKSNKLLSDSLTDKLVQYRAIDKWNGTMPTYFAGGSLPFIVQGK